MRRFTTKPLTNIDLGEMLQKALHEQRGRAHLKPETFGNMNKWLQQQFVYQKIHLSNTVLGAAGWHIPKPRLNRNISKNTIIKKNQILLVPKTMWYLWRLSNECQWNIWAMQQFIRHKYIKIKPAHRQNRFFMHNISRKYPNQQIFQYFKSTKP
jgi:hypothetical protein